MASRVAALLMVVAICAGFAAAEIVVDCCLDIGEKPLPLQILHSYIIQEGGKGCDISATAFITKAGRQLCVAHPREKAWVKKLITYLEKRRNQ